MLTRDQIIGADDLKHEEVEVPEWSGSVILWELTGTERDELETDSIVTDDLGNEQYTKVNVRARMVAFAVKDEAGKRLFSVADVEALGKKNGRTLDRLFWIARRLSKLDKRDIEDLEKNSQSGQPA
jgi:hypothetical protein